MNRGRMTYKSPEQVFYFLESCRTHVVTKWIAAKFTNTEIIHFKQAVWDEYVRSHLRVLQAITCTVKIVFITWENCIYSYGLTWCAYHNIGILFWVKLCCNFWSPISKLAKWKNFETRQWGYRPVIDRNVPRLVISSRNIYFTLCHVLLEVWNNNPPFNYAVSSIYYLMSII